jgi:hypothetical protein
MACCHSGESMTSIASKMSSSPPRLSTVSIATGAAMPVHARKP